MIQVNINEIKAKLSKYLAAVARGETVVISRRNVPVAEIRPVAPPLTEPRTVGQGPREEGYELPEAFWEPLPGELLRAFTGDDPDAQRDGRG